MTFVEPPALTVLMPCLNEAETVAACVRKARAALDGMGIRGEVLVADNGSTDGSAEIALREGARVVRVAEKGYGSALRGGIEGARGRWIVMGDADDSYDFSNLAPFVERLQGGSELVMGCRLPAGGGRVLPGAMPWKHRWIGNPVLSFLGRLFFRTQVRDFHCGLRAFSREAIRRVDLRTTGMEFASEMVIKATLAGLRISEVPVTLHPDGRSRAPHLRSWRDGWRHLRFMLLFSPRWLFLFPGAFLALFGLLVGGRLTAGPIVFGTLGFDTNTLLASSMATIVGLQICFFGLFTRIFAIQAGFLPDAGVFLKLERLFSLERGVVAGLFLLCAGVVLFGRALFVWAGAGFGHLSYPDSLRMVIPAVTMITVGVQIVFSSFFLSVLSLARR
jgi:glycosyltransferase involved in cell wall biosynthesis